jgi:hypothetical protein
MGVKEVQLNLGNPPKEKCQICKKTEKKGEPYDKFFTEEERRELFAMAVDNPSLSSMFPPEGAKYLATVDGDVTKARRKNWKDKRHKSDAKPGVEYHHPHALGAGGCPIHQDPFVEKAPVDQAEKDKIDKLDKEIQDIVDGAVERARAQGRAG